MDIYIPEIEREPEVNCYRTKIKCDKDIVKTLDDILNVTTPG
jgi:hypothetical protein